MIKDKLQHTTEREPDFLFKVCHDNPQEDYIAHFEFQIPNDFTMPDRMLFYRHLAKMMHQLPVKQVLFYLGNEDLIMPNFLDEPDLSFRFPIIDIRTIKSSHFLLSDIPQAVLFAILGDYEGESPEKMMEKIINRLRTLSKSKKEFQKVAKHLHILTGLRKLHKIYNLKIKNMINQFDLDFSDDPIFIEGVEIGVEQGKAIGIDLGEDKKATVIVENMLIDSTLSIKRIAEFVEESEDFVINIKNKLIKEGKLKVKISKKK